VNEKPPEQPKPTSLTVPAVSDSIANVAAA
jgi:hypothetical protein